MLEITQESRIAQTDAQYNFLNALGKTELEFILMFIHKKHSLKIAKILPHLAALLFVYLMPAEVFCVCSRMIAQSRETF